MNRKDSIIGFDERQSEEATFNDLIKKNDVNF